MKELGNKEDAIKEAVKYCRKHDILKEYLEINASEILNMLLTEWNWDDAKEVWQEEAREEGREQIREIARNLLAKGNAPEYVQEITGLDLETIMEISKWSSERIRSEPI